VPDSPEPSSGASAIRALFAKENRFVGRIAALAAIGGFLFGYDTGIISVANVYAAKSLHFGTLGESWTVGALLLGAIGGAALAGWTADAFSRKWTKFAGGCIYALAALGSAFAPTLITLCTARFVLGFAVGTASFVAPMYISEQAPKALRGGLTTFNQVMITLGILVAYIAGFALKGFTTNWRWMLGFGAAPGVALAIGMVLVPHTPRWLVQRGKEDRAKEVLQRTRSEREIEDELDEIKDIAQSQHAAKLRKLWSPRIRPLLIVGIALAVFQQILGINTVIYFGTTIVGFMGYKVGASVGVTVYLGIINWVFAVIAVLLMDKVGRRPLLLVGTAGQVLGLLSLGFFFLQSSAFQHANPGWGVGSVMFYLAAFEISLGPVFWLMISEIFPLRIRGKAMAVATMFNWTFNFFVSYFFLDMTHGIGRDGTFWMYAFFGMCAFAFFFFRVPETKNRSLEQIESEIRDQGSGRDRKAA
jgi:sugar porter (SP) family MFS transporter